jgi:hypothetical protein
MTRLLIALLTAALLASCAADGGLKPGVGEAMLGVGLATLGVAVAARQPVYVVPARPCYQTYYGWRCF